MTKYFFVSYVSTRGIPGIGFGNCYIELTTQKSMALFNLKQTEEWIAKDLKIEKVSIVNYKEITKEEFEANKEN